VSTFEQVWARLSKSKAYREAFVESRLKRGIPFQTRSLRKKRGWSQAQLAAEAGVTQGVISRAEDPDYGNLTLNTILRVAAGLDVAFVGKFVPYSELAAWTSELSETSIRVPSFEEEQVSIRVRACEPERGTPVAVTQFPKHQEDAPLAALLGRQQSNKQSEAERSLNANLVPWDLLGTHSRIEQYRQKRSLGRAPLILSKEGEGDLWN
jgi:transcriptional regulator with XRE-family HTH domain